jgi:uncharacterized protein (DUF2237 family)
VFSFASELQQNKPVSIRSEYEELVGQKPERWLKGLEKGDKVLCKVKPRNKLDARYEPDEVAERVAATSYKLVGRQEFGQ